MTMSDLEGANRCAANWRRRAESVVRSRDDLQARLEKAADERDKAEAALEEAAAEFERRAQVYARKRAECKAAEDRDRASGNLVKGHSYKVTWNWNYYEGLSRAYEADARLTRKKQAALKGDDENRD